MNSDESGLEAIDNYVKQLPKDRRNAWASIVTEAFTILMRPIPTGAQMRFTIYSFDKLCSAIPTSKLRAVYMESISRRDSDGNLPYWDARLMLSVWQSKKKPLPDFNPLDQYTENVCEYCFGSGVEILKIEADGRTTTAARKCKHCI